MKKTMSVTRSNTIAKTTTYCILIAVFIVTIFPIVYAVFASFKTNLEILTNPGRIFPKNPTLSNYTTALTSKSFNVPHMLFNSTYYTVANVIITITISSMAGYVFARGDFPGKKLVFSFFTLLMFVKTGGLEIYPKFEILKALHMNKGLPALLFLHLFGVPTVNMYLVKGFVASLPKELDEVAAIDGCSFIGTFFRITLPLLKPILATIGILAFQGSWNEYLMPTVFTSSNPAQQTLIVGLMKLKNSSGAATSWNLMLAGSVIALLPVLIAYTVGNKYFVSGLAAGAVKG